MNRVQYRLVALSVTPSWVVHDFFLHAIESRSDFKCDVEKKERHERIAKASGETQEYRENAKIERHLEANPKRANHSPWFRSRELR